MATINKAGLLSKLTEIVNTDYEIGSYVIDDVLSTSLSMSNLNEVNIITVSSIDFLPNLKYYNSTSGMLYYVNDIDVFAVSSNFKWLTLDGRLLRQDSLYGKIWAWGNNGSGRLGTNTVTDTSSPVSVVGGFTDWCQISTSAYHNLAVRINGTAWGWGRNTCGVVGDGSSISRSSPVSVVGGFTDWCQVSAGYIHSLAVRQNGTAWAWGRNSLGLGVLGDNTTADKSSPVSVVGGFTDWCQLSAGKCHSLGVRTNGSLWGWGLSNIGQLGDNTTVAKCSPVSVVGGFTDWCQVSAGGYHTLAVRTNGSAWAWGCNGGGQIGDNTLIAKSSPVSVVGGFTDWCQVSAGRNHSLGVRCNGTAWAWGCNTVGRLGDGTISDKSSPVSVVGGFTDWCQVSGSTIHSLGVRQNGSAWAWGCGACGMLGAGTVVTTSSPVSVVGGFTNWCQVSAGLCHSLGVIVL